jgi:hypothetical protein
MVVYVGQQCENKPGKKEQQFPRNEHWHHLPSSGRQTKEICFPVFREATATVWHSYGCICTAHILPQVACFVKWLFLL